MSKENLKTLFKTILRNQAFQLFVGAILAYSRYFLFPSMINHTVPTLRRFVLDFIVFNLVREATSYYIHRAFHHRIFYKHVHKQHHQWTSTIALAAIYCHPIEHLVLNIFPLIVGPALMSSHNLTTFIWIGYVILETNLVHCGYQLPFTFISPVFHDFHHLKYAVFILKFYLIFKYI